MRGQHSGGESQNQGNMLGERPVVRQSRLYRQHEGGNSMKALLGADNLAWEADKQQGVFQGRPVYDHNTADPYARNQASNRGSSMGMYTNSDFHSTYETTSGGYGHGSTVSSTTNFHDPNVRMNSNQTSRTNRSNNSTGIAGALNPDADEQPRWDSRAAQYEQESSASAYPLSKMVGGGGHRTPGGESANSLAAYTSRRGVQTEERTTRPW